MQISPLYRSGCMTKAVQIDKLGKSYVKGAVPAVNGISLDIIKGEIFGIIGADGAGKTTLFRMLSTLILPDFGKAQVFGFDVSGDYKLIRKFLGYMPGRFSLYQDLTVEENLIFFATLSNTTIEENFHLIEDIYIQIAPFKDRRAGKLSGGMKQKLALCCALIHNPRIMFLDEPTTGVDPVSRKEFWTILERLKAQEITIVVSTPYMDEARLCDRIALMEKGEILAIDEPDEMVKHFPHHLYEVKASNRFKLLSTLRAYPNVLNAYAFGEFAHVVFKEAVDQQQLITYLQTSGQSNIVVRPVRPNIEDHFIHLLQP